MYPLNRNRRLRSSQAIRDLVRETSLSNKDFIVPIFAVEGKNIKNEILSMPDYFIEHKTQEEQIAEAGLDEKHILEKALSLLERHKIKAIS